MALRQHAAAVRWTSTSPTERSALPTHRGDTVEPEVAEAALARACTYRSKSVNAEMASACIVSLSTIIQSILVAMALDCSGCSIYEVGMQISPGSLLEAAPDAMIAVHRNGTIRFVNGQTEAIFGYTRTELLGERVELLIPERLRGNHSGHIGAFFETPKIRSMGAGLSLLGRHSDGTEFPIEVSLSPVEIAGEVFVMAAVRNVTDRKLLEQTLEATRAQMIASSRLSALGEMAGGIAHEINNPLAIIHALASNLVEQTDATPEEAVQCARRIVQYADRITKIVKSLRHIARDGDQDPFEEASVSTIVEQTLDLCSERFR